ncbi:MAG: helix-turn-helix domain-containing protein [Pseudobdellovibrio sp.]|nr:helix-turn-helix domain-containing protein [Pseudobdellovibrio sp.]
MTEFFELGQYLKEKRVSSGFTQAELAGKLGDVHTQFVSNWERGMCAPPNHCFQLLISVLDLNRDKLVKVMLADSKKIISKKVFAKPKRQKRAI